ncbi:hypothetical protein [Cryobacterium tepidiphilum]|uniref:SAF domain-containing protein n=1 Tax=Cryobacterium tepidiphilum TaxID=2486026 RepID=A0A3M8KU22_9MICO|nr:hypothetical protein [Cryobacterium tepidiphilum]RNE56801.1 hypothetical protein EEJ31_12840 [Cryobacterium tepidiphilum]
MSSVQRRDIMRQKKGSTTGSTTRGAGATPAAGRYWVDPRFVIGLVLVAASIAGVWFVVGGMDTSVAVYAARAPLQVGDRVGRADLVATPVRMESAASVYVTPATLPPGGLLVTRTVAAGELLPRASVGTSAGASVTRLVVDTTETLSGSLTPGAVADVWSARQVDHGRFGPPVVLVTSASVVRVIERTGLMTGGSGQSVEILVPKDKVAAVLESVANEDAIALVPVNAPLEG